MTKRKLPDQLSTFPAELFGVLKWSHEKLTENGVEIKEVTVGSNLPKPQATRLRFRLNQLRKSLEFWAPNDELSEQAKNLMFVLSLTVPDGKSVGSVIARLRSVENLLSTDELPGFDRIMKSLSIPESELDPAEVERRTAAMEARDTDIQDEPLANPPIPAASAKADYMDQVLAMSIKSGKPTEKDGA